MWQCKCQIWLADYNGNLASMTIYPGDHTDETSVFAGVIAFCDALEAVTTASIVKVRVIYDNAELGLSPAQPGADVFFRCILIFREGDEWASISIPAPGNLPFDTEGNYRAIRIQRAALELSDLHETVLRLVQGYLTPVGSIFPTTFVVGGLTRIIE